MLKERNKVKQFFQQTVLWYNCYVELEADDSCAGTVVLSYGTDEIFCAYRIYMALKSIIINSPELK